GLNSPLILVVVCNVVVFVENVGLLGQIAVPGFIGRAGPF
ncbi:unnamed protein product, partial [marine sediment metagenome]